MHHYVRAGVIGLLLSLLLAASAAAADVGVRVEGAAQTLVPEVVVDAGAPVTKDGTTCAANTAAAALERAAAGAWDADTTDFGLVLEGIKGEQHQFSSGRYWSLWVNGAPAQLGVCDQALQPGDDVLFFAACGDPGATGCFAQDILDVRAPVTVRPGEPFTVSVQRHRREFGQPDLDGPAAGATVTGGGATATAGADGIAAVTLTQRGPVTLTATNGTQVRDSVTVCVTDGADGFCGYQVPGPGGPVDPPVGDDGAPADTTRPAVAIKGLRKTYRKRKAPRTLRAQLSDAGGLGAVKLALTRTRKGKCSGFGDRRGKFRRIKCGKRLLFSVGVADDVSYLLPKKLPRGRYRFDVIGIDKAGNRTERRKRFRVR